MPTFLTRFKLAYSGGSKISVVGLRGFRLNPAVLTYVSDVQPSRPARHRGRRRERRLSKRLDAETIEHLVAEYVAGTTAAELGRRYGIAKSSVLGLVRRARERVRHPRLSPSEAACLVELYGAGTATEGNCQTSGP